MFPDPESPTLTSRRVAGLARSLPFMQALHGQTVVIVEGGAASDARTRHAFAQDVALLALTGVRPIVVQGIPAASGTQSVHAVHAAMAGINHELVRLIGSHGAKAIGIGCNVADGESAEAAVERVVAELGGIHVLINNAGVTRDNLLFKMTELDWDLVMGVHLKGAFLMSKAAQKHFVAQKYGKIVNLSSVSALGNRGQANYSAAKMGIQGFTRTLGIELGPFGINANAIAPGFIATEMTDATAARLKMDVEEFRKRGEARAKRI